MPKWGSDDKTQQQAAAANAPTATATGASQECAGCPPPGPGPGPGPTPVDPPKPIPKIVRIEWLHGAAEEVLSGEGLHFVNMPSAATWVGGSLAANLRRLGQTPGYKVWFDQPGSHGFKVKLLPDGGNAAYTATEEGRNAKFKADKAFQSHTTRADGTAVVEAGPQLTVAGGDKYKLEAHDDHAVIVKSGTIKTIRALHVLKVKMRTLTGVMSSMAGCKGEYAGHHIRLVELADVEIPHQPNIGSEAESNLLDTNVAAAWETSQGKAKSPYALGIVFTDHLAVKRSGETVSLIGQQVGPGRPPATMNITGPGLLPPHAIRPRALWRDLVPGEDWYIAASYQPDGGGAPVPMPRGLFTPATPFGVARSLSVDVSGLPAGTGNISLTLNWVDRMRMGIAVSGPSVLVCTRVNWRDVTNDEQNQTLVHELGHQFDMVPKGTGNSLDAHADQYTASGHAGSHCHHGVPAQANYSGAAGADCVMFGEIRGFVAYCSLCAPQVKKVDLTSGW